MNKTLSSNLTNKLANEVRFQFAGVGIIRKNLEHDSIQPNRG